MARPKIYADDTRVFIRTRYAKNKLQAGSVRRAIINKILDEGGVTTVAELSTAFDFDTSATVGSLVRDKWLELDGE